MRKLLFCLGAWLLSLSTYAIAMNVGKIDPPCWFTGMKNPELQLMIYGENIKNSDVSVDYPGVSINRIVKLESPNYLLVYLNIAKETNPGNMSLTFKQGKTKSHRNMN